MHLAKLRAKECFGTQRGVVTYYCEYPLATDDYHRFELLAD